MDHPKDYSLDFQGNTSSQKILCTFIFVSRVLSGYSPKNEQFAPEKWLLGRRSFPIEMVPFHGDILIFSCGG